MYVVLWLVLVVVLAMGVGMFAAFARDINQRVHRAEGAAGREEDLKARLDEMEARQVEIVQRLENLEAIVTSEAWDAGERTPPVSLDAAVDAPEEPGRADPSAVARAEAARLARRLRG